MSQVSLEVTEERPWLSLLPFTEATQRFFFGRDQEIRDLFLRVREHPLTVLYGRSGLGKSSLLGAGLVPKLRTEGYRPLLLRLVYEEGWPPLAHQLYMALNDVLDWGHAPANAELAERPSTLWERFHDRRLRAPDLAAAPPVLVLDQFEEVFTLTEQSAARQREAEALFEELADLVENRPPAAVQQRLRADRALARELDFTASPARVVMTLREDYLSHLEVWKKTLPALMRNRMALTPLSGPNALDAVVKPGRLGGSDLVSGEVGRRIVCFVARRPVNTPLEEIRAVPPLLSLLCYELNEARLAASPPQPSIGIEEVDRQGADILQNFYERSFAGLPVEVRRFIEDWLITVGGHRNAVAREDALAELREKGLPDAGWALDQLVNGRLLASEDRSGIQRLELTHDVLAPLAVRSRDRRRERERAERAEAEQREVQARVKAARGQRTRLRWIIAAVSVAAAAALLAATLAVVSARQATAASRLATALVEEASRKAVGAAQASFARGDHRAGLAYMAEALRYRPENERVRMSAASYLVQTPVVAPLPVGSPMRHREEASAQAGELAARGWEISTGRPPALFTTLSPDGRKVLRLGARDETSGIWDVANGLVVELPDDTRSGAFSADGRWALTVGEDNGVRLWDVASGRGLGVHLSEDAPVSQASFSRDGRSILTASGGTARVWNAAIGRSIAERIRQDDLVDAASFSRDGRWLVTAGEDGIARVWDPHRGRPNGPPILTGSAVDTASFSTDGRLILTGAADRTARVWDAASRRAKGPPIRSQRPLESASFSPDGRSVVTVVDDRTARVWDSASGKPLGQPMKHGGVVDRATFNGDGRLVVTATADGTAQIWDAATGKPAAPPFRHRAAVETASLSPDGRWLVTGCTDGTAALWDVGSGQALGAAMKHDGGVVAASFSPDGRLVLTAANRGDHPIVQLWRVPSGAPIGAGMEHEGPFVAASFSPDSRLLLTASGDGVVRTWGTRLGRQLGAPMKHDGVRAATFSPDGRWVLTAGTDGVVRMWEVPHPGPARDAYLAFESLGGQRVSDQGLVIDVPLAERISLRGRLRGLDSGDWGRLVRWYLADPRTRTVSPHASLTVPEHVEREIDWVMDHADASNAGEILDAAYALDPSHPLILFALAALKRTPVAARDLYVQLGLERLPPDPRICARAAEILRSGLNAPGPALVAARRALASDPTMPAALAVAGWARGELGNAAAPLR